jgi:hypothetical protein
MKDFAGFRQLRTINDPLGSSSMNQKTLSAKRSQEVAMELKGFIELALDALQKRYYRALTGLTAEELAWQAGPKANPIGFIFWHITRVEDRLVLVFAQGQTDVWVRDGWYERWGIPAEATGLEYPPEHLANFPLPALSEMKMYSETVRHETLTYLRNLESADFEVRPSGTPYPESRTAVTFFKNYTVGQMFCQFIGEANQHLGQVAYIRGLLHEFKSA